MKKYAFLIMGDSYDPDLDTACFSEPELLTCIYTVRNYEEARRRMISLRAEGFGAVELCGAFGADKARELSALADETMAVGYVVHDPEQDRRFDVFFSDVEMRT